MPATRRETIRKSVDVRAAVEREITIPPVENWRRRKRREKDPLAWLKGYFPHLFFHAWTLDQREMVDAILHRAETGGDQSLAAPRGGGKTTVAIGALLFAILTGRTKFAVLVAATGPDARRLLANLKSEVERNELLRADYPHECYPAVCLGGAVQRKNQQTYKFELTKIDWSKDQVIFPSIAESPAAGTIVMARGLDAAIRGLIINGKRPDFALVDDVETRDSAASEYQVGVREGILDNDIGGLAGPGVRFARVALVTIQNARCLSARLTDPKIKPSWNGRRYRLLVTPPERLDLWDQYVELRKQSQAAGDPDARAAHAFYLLNRAEMDRGAVVNNPQRFVRDKLPNGSQVEVSALQHCFNIIADKGERTFATEFQNDPPEEARDQQTTGLTALVVERRLSGLVRGELPPACKVVIGLDLGKRAHHWVALAARTGAVGNIIDYGVSEVAGNNKADMPQETIDLAIVRSLLDFRDRLLSRSYVDPSGEIIQPSLVMVDSGSFTDAAYEAIRKLGEPWRACKGIGSNFRHGQPSATRRVGAHWFADWHVQQRIWLHLLDTIHFKRSVHERFLTDPIDPAGRAQHGSLTLFVPAGARDHHSYARHMLSEEWIVRFEQGKGEIAKWVEHSENNHYLDATAMALAGAEILGHGLFTPRVVSEPKTLAQVMRGE